MKTLARANRAIIVTAELREMTAAYDRLRDKLYETSICEREVIEILALVETYVDAAKEELRVRSCT